MHFLQDGSSSSTPDNQKLLNRIQNLEDQLRGQKRKADHHDKGKGKGKKGKGKKGKDKDKGEKDYK